MKQRNKLIYAILVSGKTRDIVAKLSGIHYQTLSRIMKGAVTTTGTMESIAAALNKTPKQVFGKEYEGDK